MSIPNRMKTSAIDFLAATLIAALVVVVPTQLCAQQNATPTAGTKSAPPAEEENGATSEHKPGEEGIKVHGHWILDVKDKDGKLVEHRDFHNALVGDGATTLITLLAGMSSAEGLEVGLATAADPYAYGLYVPSSAFATACPNYFTYACYANLTRSFGSNTQTSKLNSIILTGSIPGLAAGYTVTTVYTLVNTCGVASGTAATTVAPASCTANINATSSANQFYISQFTTTTVTPLTVQPGQSLSVSVTLSFS